MRSLLARGIGYVMHIGDWIDDTHLDPDAVSAYRQSLQTSAGHAVALDGFLKPGKLQALRKLFTGDGAFAEVTGLFDRHPHGVSSEEYAAAAASNRFYRYRTLTGPARPMAPGFLAHLLFATLAQSPSWLAWLGAIAGTELATRTGIHARIMTRDMVMNRHSDRSHGPLCAVLYLNQGWSPAFGGTFVQERDGVCVAEVEPLANRLLVFSPDSGLAHGVAPFAEAMGVWERWSYSLWYGSGSEGGDPH